MRKSALAMLSLILGCGVLSAPAVAETRKWSCTITNKPFGSSKVDKIEAVLEVDFDAARYQLIFGGKSDGWRGKAEKAKVTRTSISEDSDLQAIDIDLRTGRGEGSGQGGEDTYACTPAK